MSVVVDDVTIAAETLTKIEGDLELDTRVEVKAVAVNAGFRGSKIEQDEDEESEGDEKQGFDLEGQIEAITCDENGNITTIVVDGQTISVGALTRLTGTLEVDATVRVEGVVSWADLIARKIEADQKEDQLGALSLDQDATVGGQAATALAATSPMMVTITITGKTAAARAATPLRMMTMTRKTTLEAAPPAGQERKGHKLD